MKDLIEFILKHLTTYVPLLISIVASPKRTISNLIAGEADRLNKAMFFAGVTIGLAFVLQAPLLPAGKDIVTVAGSLLVLKILAFLSFAGFMVLAFKAVGGTGNYEDTLCACLYITSPWYLFQVLVHIICLGIIATHDPALATAWSLNLSLNDVQIEALFRHAPGTAIAFSTTLLLSFVVGIVWFIICWGVYRKLHQVSFFKSAFVYVITTVLWYSYWWLVVLAMKGLHGGVLSPIG